MSSSERPAAAVRMITPPMKPCCSRKDLTMPRRRARSSRDSILRDTPTWSTVGMKTRKRPGMVTCEVSRAPLVPSGSLTTWTRISWPSLSRSSIFGSGLSRSRSSRAGPRPRRSARTPPFCTAGADESAAGKASGSTTVDVAGDRERRRRVGAALVVFVVLVLSGFEAVEFLDRVDDLRDVEEGVPFESDVNERGLHAGEDLRDPPLVDVADHAARALALDEDLDDLIVLEDGDPRVVVAGGDDHLLVHG